ncbi:hypothetical protein EMCRGX_G030604 [Ephydatia muelleri]
MYLCMNRIAQQLLQVRTLQAAYALMAASKQVSTLEDVHLTQCQDLGVTTELGIQSCMPQGKRSREPSMHATSSQSIKLINAITRSKVQVHTEQAGNHGEQAGNSNHGDRNGDQAGNQTGSHSDQAGRLEDQDGNHRDQPCHGYQAANNRKQTGNHDKQVYRQSAQGQTGNHGDGGEVQACGSVTTRGALTCTDARISTHYHSHHSKAELHKHGGRKAAHGDGKSSCRGSRNAPCGGGPSCRGRGSKVQRSTGPQTLDSAGSQTLDGAGSQTLDSAGSQTLDGAGPQTLDGAGPQSNASDSDRRFSFALDVEGLLMERYMHTAYDECGHVEQKRQLDVGTEEVGVKVGRAKQKREGETRKGVGKGRDTVAPNAFVSIRVRSPTIRMKMEEVQAAMEEREPLVVGSLVSLEKLHVTMMVVNLHGKEQIQKAQAALREAAVEALQVLRVLDEPLVLQFRGLRCFGERVVYAALKDDEAAKRLSQLADIVTTVFEKNGFQSAGTHRAFSPHLTIAKSRHLHNRVVGRASDMAGKSEDGRTVSLAYRGLEELPLRHLGQLETIRHLDLSNNNFSDLRALREFTGLGTLILDRNNITSHVVFPSLPQLEVLWVNHNKIANLALFIQTISSSFPNLKNLSMMDNEAAPSYFNGGSKQEYLDYRAFVISRLPKLTALDDSVVVAAEGPAEHENERSLWRPTAGAEDLFSEFS